MQTIKLDGIDGQHLWGFLTAIGVLSLLDGHARLEGGELPSLAFEQDGTAWLRTPVAKERMAGVLFARLQALQPVLERDLADVKRPGDFTPASFERTAQLQDPQAVSLLAGLACVVAGDAFESTLCAANGASHQHLIQSMRDVLQLAEEEHLRLALFEPWQRSYRVPDDKRQKFQLGSRKPTLRLDPADERLYALRFSNPTTTDDFSTELGAQALAIPAFALLPVVPRRHPVTVASARHRQRVTFAWPLWNVPARLATVRSLLWSGVDRPEVQRSRGVFAAFSADRVSGAKGKLSFAPSQGVW